MILAIIIIIIRAQAPYIISSCLFTGLRIVLYDSRKVRAQVLTFL